MGEANRVRGRSECTYPILDCADFNCLVDRVCSNADTFCMSGFIGAYFTAFFALYCAFSSSFVLGGNPEWQTLRNINGWIIEYPSTWKPHTFHAPGSPHRS